MRIHSLLRGAHAYLPADATLAGLTAAEVASRPQNAEHSIAEIVAHMAFWQEWFLDRCDGRHVPAPARAELGWPAVNGMTWEAVYDRFATGFNRALKLADDEPRIAQPIAPPLEFGPIASYTIGDALIHMSLHNAHHLGQVIAAPGARLVAAPVGELHVVTLSAVGNRPSALSAESADR